MRRRAILVWIWLLTTMVAVSIANAAVSSVRSAVTDTPAPLGLPEADRVTTSTSEPLDPMAPAAVARDPAPPEVSSSSTVGVNQPAPSTSSTTSTTAAVASSTTSSTTTTVAPPPSQPPAPEGGVFTYVTDGGWVTVLVVGDEIRLEAAGPEQGWKVEIESAGPTEVVVSFERRSGKDEEITLHASVEDGRPKVEIGD